MTDQSEREEQLLRQLLYQAEQTREQLALVRDYIVKRHRHGFYLEPPTTLLLADTTKLLELATEIDKITKTDE